MSNFIYVSVLYDITFILNKHYANYSKNDRKPIKKAINIDLITNRIGRSFI